MNRVEKYTDKGVELVMTYGPKILLALLTLIIGLWLVKRIVGLVKRGFERRNVDATLAPFLASLVSWTLRAVLFISVASMVGVETTSFVAILGAAGLAVGLALQGSLSNLAGGVLILIFRPYEVGHLVECQGQLGVVQEIQIFTTTLLTPQNRRVVVPNGPVMNGTIVNYTVEGMVRVDMTIGVAYESDIAKAKNLLLDLLKGHELVLEEPAPGVGVKELADSSVNFAVLPYAKPEHYWAVWFDVHEKAKEVLESNGITIPFPQRDVHLHQT